jgi:PKD repeat protein
MYTDTGKFFTGAVFGLLILFFTAPAAAFQGFDDGGGGGVPSCATCHGTLANSGPGSAAHDAHAAPANACSDCHSGGFDNPALDNCVQCHGRNEDAGGDNASAGIARGLRLHHSVTGAASCGSCHSDALGAVGVGENVLPAFYAQAFGGAGLDSCDGSEESFASSTISLDNDGDGLTDSADPDCSQNQNEAPTANPNGPYNAIAGSPVVFSSAGSLDPDGTIVSYDWDFGDGSSGTGAAPQHAYQADGTFTVLLTVTDDGGATGSASTTATITPAPIPPSADAGGPYSGLVGTPVNFDGTGSGDADGSVVAYAWDFGDGGVSNEASPAHSYSVDGAFTVTLTVTDNDGLTGTDTTTATINPAGGNTPPVANANGPYSGTEGAAVQFSSMGSSDPDGSISVYAWDFGDGNTSSAANPAHSYVAAGTYTVTLTVTDNSGDSAVDSTSAAIEAVVVNMPPSANAGGPYSGSVGESVSFDASASADPDGVIVRYDWDFGDGATVADAGPTPTHIFAAAGDYTVTLTVTDDAGESDSATTTATLTERGAPMDGEAQYNNYCASCHGDPWVDPPVDPALAGAHRVAGARACSIEASIFGTSVFPNGAPGMGFLQTLVSDGTIDAQQLADYLNSRSVSGEQRYVAACAGCHGDDGRGGRTRESVLGESAHETREAIREEHEMRFLACLPDADIDAITLYLGGSTGGGGSAGEDSEDDDDDDERGGGAVTWLLLMLGAMGFGRGMRRHRFKG